jgi:hypothetical protein
MESNQLKPSYHIHIVLIAYEPNRTLTLWAVLSGELGYD